MARPTRAEQERRRIADLLKEGKGPDGQPIEEGTIISETKNPVVENNSNDGGIVISELENEITNSTLGKGAGDEKTGNAFDITSGDAKAVDTDDPNYVKPSGHDRFRESLIENESDANKAATGNPSSSSIGTGLGNSTPPPPPPPKEFSEPVINGSAGPETPVDDKKKNEPLNPDLDDLSPTEKRRNVEMFADAIITNYSMLYEAAFTKLCTINMNKMEILDRQGNIRLSMAIERTEAGDMTVRQIILANNEEASKTFIVDDATKLALREPLIAVLMEKGIAPTPIVTLLIVLGGHILTGVLAAVELKGKMNEQLESFKVFRKEELEREFAAHKNQQHNTSTSGPQMKAEPVRTEEPKKEAVVVSMEEVMNTKPVEIKSEAQENSNSVTIEEVVNPE